MADFTEEADSPLLGERNSSPGNIQGESDRRPVSISRQFIVTLISCLAAVSGGISLGYSSPVLLDLQNHGLLDSSSKVTWFGSLLTIGAAIGGPLAGTVVDRLGRKLSVMLCAVPYLAGWCCLAGINNYLGLFAGRVLTGIGLGMTSLCVPTYIAETATKTMRGVLGSTFQLSIVFGILTAFVLGVPLYWKWLAIVGGAPAGLLVVFMAYLPETPRWLLMKERRGQALQSLAWLRGPDADIEEECQEIVANLPRSDEKTTLNDFKQRKVIKPLAITLALMAFQQLSGVNAVIFYTESIFQASGYSGSASTPSIIIGAVQFVTTFIGCLIIEKLGRRLLLSVSGIFMCISAITLGLYYYLSDHGHDNLGWLSLASLIVYNIAFSIGWGPIPWLMMSEILPTKVKGPCSSLATFANWMCSFVVTKEFSDLEKIAHNDGAFWLFGGVCFCSVIFVVMSVPETKGKTLEEIEEYFDTAQTDNRNSNDSNEVYGGF